MILEEYKLATVIGIVVLTVSGAAITILSGPFGSMIGRDSRIFAAFIYGCFTMVGIILSTLLSLLAAWLKERRDRRRLASALMAEVYAFADLAAHAGQAARARSLSMQVLTQIELSRYQIPSTIVYAALAERLMLLPGKEASSIVSFYGAIGRVEKVMNFWNASFTHASIESAQAAQISAREQTNQLADAWTRAAQNGIHAIEALRPFMAEARRSGAAKQLDALISRLNEVATPPAKLPN